jgi:hypothetical protein
MKLPILQDLLATVAASIFLTKLVKLSETSRAKIIATGLLPLAQTKQFFSPAFDPLIFSGWNGPGIVFPTSGPDFSSSATAPAANIAPHSAAPSQIARLMKLFSRGMK